MISVGIDISKGKSTVCIMKPYGEVIRASYEIKHTEKDLSDLADIIGNINSIHLLKNIGIMIT